MQTSVRVAASSFLLWLGSSSCGKDVELPPPPGPGSVSGRVLAAEPGRVEQRPVVNAEIRLLASGVATTTGAGGTFSLPNLEVTRGLLLIRADIGGVVRQRVVQLADFGTGAQRHVDLGDVVLGENARVRGKVVRGDRSQPGGHGGTTVFVPAGPYSAFTADDGTFTLEQMPEGPIELYAFRDAYEPAAVGRLTLRSGETVELGLVTLRPATQSQAGSVRGRFTFVPTVDAAGDLSVTLRGTSSSSLGVVDGTGGFVASSVPVGLYHLEARRSGYGQLDVLNLLVTSGADVDLGTLTMTTAPAFDAGPPPQVPDAGPMDAGLPDAGAPDAGATDGGLGTPCLVQSDCDRGFWCDSMRCVPLCLLDADCGFGRVCDVAVTRTCLTSCVGTCSAGQVCSSQNVCRAVCDGAFPCPSGQRCSVGQCVPECAIDADCGNPFLGCDHGACRANGQCAGDDQCAREQLCVAGQCTGRPTDAGVLSDGGTWSDGGLVFSCAQACQCRTGEQCRDGTCQPDVVPVRFVAPDAGGDGLTPGSPSGDPRSVLGDGGLVVALLEGSFDLGAATLSVPSGTTLAGGFVACGSNRWVRDAAKRTEITGTGGPINNVNWSVVSMPAAGPSFALFDVRLTGLKIRTTGSNRCGTTAGLYANFVHRLTIDSVDFALELGTCNLSGLTSALAVSNSTEVLVERSVLTRVTSGGLAGSRFLYFYKSAGVIQDVRSNPFQVSSSSMEAVRIESPVGPTTFRRADLGRFVDASASTSNFQFFADDCGSFPLLVEDVAIGWPQTTVLAQGQSDGVRLEDCSNATLRRIAVTSDGHSGGLNDQNYGVFLRNSGGTVEDVSISIPANPGTVRRVAGMHFEGPMARFQVARVQIEGTGGSGRDTTGAPGISMSGFRFENVTSGPTAITRADVTLLNNVSPHGVVVLGSTAVSDVSVTDSRFEVEGTRTCSADVIGVLTRDSVRLERNEVIARNGAFTTALYVGGSNAKAELYGNSMRVGASSGSSSCGSYGTGLLYGTYGVMVESGLLRAWGNSIEPVGQTGQVAPTVGMGCSGSPNVTFGSNIVAAGRGADVRFVSSAIAGGSCFAPTSYEKNYWFNGAAAPVSAQERLFDAGILLDGGNVFGGTVTCFAPPGALGDGGVGFPHFVVGGSPCSDRGSLGVSTGGIVQEFDLFGRPRDGGVGPDIGAVEGP